MIVCLVVLVSFTNAQLYSVVHHMNKEDMHALSAHMTRSLNPDFPAGPASKPRIDLPTADRLMSVFTFATSHFHSL